VNALQGIGRGRETMGECDPSKSVALSPGYRLALMDRELLFRVQYGTVSVNLASTVWARRGDNATDPEHGL